MTFYDLMWLSITFIIDTFQFHCKLERKQVKWNKITRDMWKSDGSFSYFQSNALFKWLLEFISSERLSKKLMITVPDQK